MTCQIFNWYKIFVFINVSETNSLTLKNKWACLSNIVKKVSNFEYILFAKIWSNHIRFL